MQIKGVAAGAVGTLAVAAGVFTAIAVANADESSPREPVVAEKTVAPTPTPEPTAEPVVAAPASAPAVEEVPMTAVPAPEPQDASPAPAPNPAPAAPAAPRPAEPQDAPAASGGDEGLANGQPLDVARANGPADGYSDEHGNWVTP